MEARRISTIPASSRLTYRRLRAPALSLPWLGVSFTILLLLLWEALSRIGAIPTDSVPAMSSVASELFSLMVTGEYWSAVGDTIVSALIGLALVVLLGTPLAIIIGLSRFVRDSSSLLVEFLKPIPPVAIIPLALLLWGPTQTMKVSLITFGALWPYLIQLVYGIAHADPTLRMMSRSYRLSRWLTVTRVLIPDMLPFAVTGIKVSASIAIIVSVVTELIGGASGLGRSIIIAQSANALPTVYALIVTAGGLGVAINSFLNIVEKPILFWHPSHRELSR